MKVLILLLAIVSIQAQAKINYARGEWGHGGGNAVVCFKQVSEARGDEVIIRNLPQEVRENGNVISDDLIQYIDSIELFDLYEAKKRRGLNPNPPKIIQIKDNENAFEYVEKVGERFRKSVPYMEEILTSTRQILPESNFLLEASAVRYQNDLGSVVIPNDHCVISTMAVQVNYNKFYKVHIDGRLFNHPKHSRLSQATLVLHETIYAFARARGQKDSGTTRELVKHYVTYGKYITEGAIARAIYNLDFDRADGEGWPGEFAKVYNESKVMQKIYSKVSNFFYGIYQVQQDYYQSYYSQFNTYTLDINKAIKAYDLYRDCNEVVNRQMDEIFESANCVAGHTKTPNPEYFEEISENVRSRYPSFIQHLDLYRKTKKQDIISEVVIESKISPKDLKRFINNFDMFAYNTLNSINAVGTFSRYLEQMQDSTKIIEDIYEFQFGNMCIAVIVDTLPNTVSVDERCVQPLKLNNIIPKK